MDELYQLFPFSGYKVKQLKLVDGRCRVILERQDSKPALCHVCGTPFKSIRNKKRRSVEDLRMLEKRVDVYFTQLQGRCPTCCKIRLEAVNFISFESPHQTKRYAFLLAKLCEISPVTSAAKLMGHSKMTMWRADLDRMRRLFDNYRLPPNLTHISVDEVYAKSKHEEDENRSDRFFTIITDLKSRKPIWVANSRSRRGLDEFFGKNRPRSLLQDPSSRD